MSKGIPNFQIETTLKNINDEDLNDNFVGVFQANEMNRFIDHKSVIFEKKGKYHFIIATTDSSDKGGTHLWRILDIEPRTDLFFFYSLYMDGLKSFIIQDDKKVTEKILFGTGQLTRTDNKITLENIKFSLSACKNLT